jgi:hypothetical protein
MTASDVVHPMTGGRLGLRMAASHHRLRDAASP